MKKLVSVLLVIVMILSMAACTKPAPVENKIKVAALESADGREPWEKIVKEFEAETGIKVDLVMDKNIEDVIGAQMKGGDYPDVVHCGLGRTAGLPESLMKADALHSLENALKTTIPGETKTPNDKLLPGFTDSSITNPYKDGLTYLAPMFYTPCGLFFNETLLKDNGWAVPKTWTEMWELGEKAKAKNIALFTFPTAGYMNEFFLAAFVGVGGQDLFNKVTSYTEGIWDTADGKAILDIAENFTKYTEKTTPANATDQSYLKNQQLILDNKAIFCPNGTWITGEMEAAPRADGFKWNMAPIPSVDGKGASVTFFEQAWIPSSAKNIEGAEKFMAFLYSDKAVEIFAAKGAIQPVKGAANGLTGDMAAFDSVYDKGATAVFGGFKPTEAVEGVSVKIAFYDPLSSLINGELTMKQYKEGLIKAFDALRPALK